jgi:hypothetical protein
MHFVSTPSGIALLIFVMNLPFGAWRARLRKLSPAWFVAIHLPVVLAIAMRILIGVPFRLITLPLYVLAFFLGQLAGARMRGGPKPNAQPRSGAANLRLPPT